jgi:hypothetical protein
MIRGRPQPRFCDFFIIFIVKVVKKPHSGMLIHVFAESRPETGRFDQPSFFYPAKQGYLPIRCQRCPTAPT